jgi:hypothetical protein
MVTCLPYTFTHIIGTIVSGDGAPGRRLTIDLSRNQARQLRSAAVAAYLNSSRTDRRHQAMVILIHYTSWAYTDAE